MYDNRESMNHEKLRQSSHRDWYGKNVFDVL